jgi:hypothetical protein
MIDRTHTHRRAGRGTLIVRASVVTAGLAASVGLQLAEPERPGPAGWAAGNPWVLCATDANGWFAFQ